MKHNIQRVPNTTGKKQLSKKDYEKLVKEIGERVWQMWKEQLRTEQERHTHRQRRS